MRINKYLAEAGVCSRRRADELVASGVVRINGKPAGMGAQVQEGDQVEVQGRPVGGRTSEPCHIVLHKPVEVVSTASDPDGRRTVLDLLPAHLRLDRGQPRRLYPVGRLDFFSEGLLLISDDGPLTHALTHPSTHIPRVYSLSVRGEVVPSALAAMRRGMTLAEGEKLAPVGVRVISRREGRRPSDAQEGMKPSGKKEDTELELTLHQGVNRQIRRMCRDLNLTVLRLVRVGFGPLQLGDLPVGKARLLTAEEVAELRQSIASR